MSNKPNIVAAVALTTMLFIQPAKAEFPDGPVRIVVPNQAGGATDTMVRTFQNPLSDALGVPIVVVNMPGGGTSVGAREVHDAEPDGQTILGHGAGRADRSSSSRIRVLVGSGLYLDRGAL